MTSNAVRQELHRLKREYGEGDDLAQHVLETARAPTSVLHGEFEWDDSVASERYRLIQARHLIRSIEVVRIERRVSDVTIAIAREAPRRVREYESPRGVRPGYRSVVDVYGDADLCADMLDTLRGELEALTKRIADHGYVARSVGNVEAGATLTRLHADLVDAMARAFLNPTPFDNGESEVLAVEP